MGNSKKLDAIGRFTADCDVEVCASCDSLNNLSTLLISNVKPLILELKISSNNPKPYQEYIARIIIKESPGLIKMQLKENDLIISGAHEYLELLSEDITYLANIDNQESDVDEHLHIEYHIEHPYLFSSTIALVFRRC